MDKESKGFVVYDEVKAVLDELTDEQIGELFRGMVDYHINGIDPNFDGVLKYVFIPLKQGIDRGDERYAATCERNRANANKRWQNREQPDAVAYDGMRSDAVDANKTKLNQTKEKKNQREEKPKSPDVDVWSLSRSVLSHLNEVTGASWRVDDVSSVRLISDLAHKGYTEEQMIEVIDKKAADWLGDPKVEQYLRPSTLFGPRFEEYLRQPASAQKKKREEAKKKEESKNAIRDQIEVRTRDLERLWKEYEDAYGNMPLRIDLRGKMAVVEAELESLRARIGG